MSKVSTEINKFRELLNDFSTGMLVTTCGGDNLRSRPMAIVKRFDETSQVPELWMATGIESPKVGEVKQHCRVNISLQASNKYLSVSGVAEVCTDRAKIAELWTEEWKLWFPGGKDDANLALLRVVPEVGEYWDYSSIGERLLFAFEASKSYMTGKPMESEKLGEHAKVQIHA